VIVKNARLINVVSHMLSITEHRKFGLLEYMLDKSNDLAKKTSSAVPERIMLENEHLDMQLLARSYNVFLMNNILLVIEKLINLNQGLMLLLRFYIVEGQRRFAILKMRHTLNHRMINLVDFSVLHLLP
jgi:hypothetical protein